MDDTTQSRTSDVAASAATRKRRSSILKSQRPPRTPFCELEFNVSTPADNTKSRRVSFSRKTGVAEFATNEATTTWKNFYEEHNKSLESSGNDSEMNHGKQQVAHLGKRMFDQQFEECEAFDYMGTLNPGINISTSINNINFAQLECTDNKLTAPPNNFELSALTETQSRLFGDNLATTCTGEVSGRIDVNFSAIQQIGQKDDLDEIQEDLQRNSNIVCQGPFTGQDVSEYIEVDLNMTHVAITNDESDMSITDTIHCPKVDVDVSKSCSIEKKMNSSNKDWVADKENIVLNPYVAPRESINFAVTEAPDEVLVFDGKRLIVETENPNKESSRQSVLSNLTERAPQRKTIVLNCNDDLPNFLEEAQVSNNQSCFVGVSEMQQSCILEDKSAHHRLDETQNKYKTIIFGDDLDDISVTQAVPNLISDVEKRQTTVYDDNVGNLSITQALPSNIIDKEKRKTILYENDNANISMTQAVPANVIISNENNERSKTMVFENESCNISVTEAIPTNIKVENTITQRETIILEDGTANVLFSQTIPKADSKESRSTIVNQDNSGNISVTHSTTSISTKENVAAPERRTTALFESDIGNISVTQALPSNIILPEKFNSTAYGNNGDISMTQALPGHILLGNNIEPNRRRTIVYEDDTGNLSITQAVTKNQVIQGIAHQLLITKDPEVATNIGKHVNIQAPNINQLPTQEKLSLVSDEMTEHKRRTIVFQNDAADISITLAVPIRQVIDCLKSHTQDHQNIEKMEVNSETCKETQQKIPVVSENDDADISLTQVVVMNQVIDTEIEQKSKEATSGSEEVQPNIIKNSINQGVDNVQKENHNIKMSNMLHKVESSNSRKTIVFENDNADVSITQAVPMNKVMDAIQQENVYIEATNTCLHEELSNKRRTVVFENDDADVSMTQAVPMNKVIETVHKVKHDLENTNVVSDTDEITNKRRTVVFENEDAEISMTQAVHLNQVIDTIRKENHYIENNAALLKKESTNKNTTVSENGEADTSITQAVVATNNVIDTIQKENQKLTLSNVALYQGLNNNRTVVENDVADMTPTATQIVDQNQVSIESLSLQPCRHKDESKHNVTQNDCEVVRNEIVYNDCTITNKTSRNNIVYDDNEGDISMTRAVSTSIILPEGQEKNRTIAIESVESLLENKDLFMEIDRLTDRVYENNSEKFSEEDYDMSISDFSDTEIGGRKGTVNNSNDVCITEATIDNFSPNKSNIVKTVEQAQKLSNPIPVGLVAIQQEIVDKSLSKVITKHDGMLPNAISDVFVYQSLSTNTQNLTARQFLRFKEDSQVTSEDENYTIEEKKDSARSSKRSSEAKMHIHEDAQSELENDDLVAETTSKHSSVKTVDSKPINSILNDLLNMSQSSFEGTEDKDLMAQISSVHEVPANTNEADEKNSMDTMFYITKDSDEERLTDKSETTSNTQEVGQIQGESPLSIEYKDDDDPPMVRDIQKKLSILKNVMREDHIPQYTHSNQNKFEDTGSKVSLDMSRRKSSKSFRMANDTNELLEMLSDFTDKRHSRNLPLEELKECDVSESRMSLDNKVELSKPEPTRFNRTLKRQSIALSREDLMNNLSMASAALQKSRSDFDDSDSTDEVKETPNISKEHKKTVRMSTDVVKTLQFDDDSISENNESIQTPLKKTAFGEITYMKETKTKVIPSFLGDISDGIKELMDDLVKPVADVQPFTRKTPERNMMKNPSICSTQIQANLLTSSQIDLHTDLYSTTESVSEMNKLSSVDIITDAVNRSMSRALTSPVKMIPVYSESSKSSVINVTSDRTEDTIKSTEQPRPASTARPLGSILVFDQHNPLNNVLLVPTPSHAIDIHRYNPIKPGEESEPQPNQKDETEKKEETVTNQYRMELSTPMTNQDKVDKADTQSITSNTSKPMSIDQCTEPENHYGRDIETNTLIAMKGNEELLEASSSLTLVDDELARNKRFSPNTSRRDTANSPVKVIYQVDEPPAVKMDSDFTSTDELDQPLKPRKRVYSPNRWKKHKNCTMSSLDLTPKPIAKMQKRSISPDYEEITKLPAERDESPEPESREKSPRKTRSKMPGTTITVQQLMTMVHVEPSNKDVCVTQDATDSSTTDPRSVSGSRDVLGLVTSSEVMSSFASSNNLRDETSLVRSSISGRPSKMEWLPMSTSQSTVDAYSSEDLVGVIDAMPCMGSHDCQWECVAGPVWTLLLLHSRLRLTIRFAHAPRLRPDTPVLSVELETPHQDKKNPIAYLCVVFAAEMMRYYMARGCSAASDVGKLVRRLAGAARLAAQWARAMHDARARLAYSLSHDGWLALKVANTSFRTVWEVTMRLELVMESARAAPWPRACGVRVTRVLAAPGGPAPPDVSRATAATPRDWGHAPRTIWKVFRYLKHKKREDEST